MSVPSSKKETLELVFSKFDTIIENQARLEQKLDYLIAYQTGDWEIKEKQMLFFDLNKEILETYDLFNANGNPTNTSVFKRVKR